MRFVPVGTPATRRLCRSPTQDARMQLSVEYSYFAGTDNAIRVIYDRRSCETQ